MKGLSIEEKAKAYDEVLEKAKIWQEHLYDVNDKDYADELNYIFPELKESEDERIKKQIIYAVKQLPICIETKEKCLAWLERQGEHDSIEEPNFFDDFRNSDVEVDSNEDGLIAETIKYKKEKQGEQNPAEWSEEDEKMIDAIYSCVDSHYDGLAKDALLIWLKSLKDRYTWKPSDRQMNVLEYYMHTLACNEHKEILFGLYQDLKKLKE